jgi:uncharacterized protein (DUF58 family)
MQKTSFILTLASIIIIVSFLGIPSSWKTVVVSLFALGVVVLAVLLRKDIASGSICLHLQSEHKTDVYAQNSALMPERKEMNEHEQEKDTDIHNA